MFYCIPLLPKNKAENWNRVGALLNGTLQSLARQKDQNFEVLLAAHDIPPNIDFQGLSVTIVEPDWRPRFAYKRDPFKDKKNKRLILGAELRKRGGGYAMLLDADDRVSNKLTKTVYERNDPFGYVIDTGYGFDMARRAISPIPGRLENPFHYYCGSCIVWNFSPDDLPRGRHGDGSTFFEKLRSHAHWVEVAKQHGRPLTPLGRPGVVYYQNTGENSHRKVDAQQVQDRIADIREGEIPLTDELVEEFSLNDDAAWMAAPQDTKKRWWPF